MTRILLLASSEKMVSVHGRIAAAPWNHRGLIGLKGPSIHSVDGQAQVTQNSRCEIDDPRVLPPLLIPLESWTIDHQHRGLLEHAQTAMLPATEAIRLVPPGSRDQRPSGHAEFVQTVIGQHRHGERQAMMRWLP